MLGPPLARLHDEGLAQVTRRGFETVGVLSQHPPVGQPPVASVAPPLTDEDHRRHQGEEEHDRGSHRQGQGARDHQWRDGREQRQAMAVGTARLFRRVDLD